MDLWSVFLRVWSALGPIKSKRLDLISRPYDGPFIRTWTSLCCAKDSQFHTDQLDLSLSGPVCVLRIHDPYFYTTHANNRTSASLPLHDPFISVCGSIGGTRSATWLINTSQSALTSQLLVNSLFSSTKLDIKIALCSYRQETRWYTLIYGHSQQSTALKYNVDVHHNVRLLSCFYSLRISQIRLIHLNINDILANLCSISVWITCLSVHLFIYLFIY